MRLIRLGSAVLTIFTVLEALLPDVMWFLPFGGSSIAQMGIVFGAAIALSTILELIQGKNDED